MCCNKYNPRLEGSSICYSNRKSLEEDGCRLIIETVNRYDNICTIKVDGCLIQRQNIKRCDYAVSPCNNQLPRFFFIELKGSDYKQAYEQIVSTVKYFQERMSDLKKENIYGVMVFSGGTGGVANQEIRKLNLMFSRHIGRRLIRNRSRSHLTI